MPVHRTCETCGAPFTTTVRLVRRGWGRFCSKRCKRTIKPETVCEGCGATFYVKPSHWLDGEGRFCSMACRSAWMRTLIGPAARRWRGGRYIKRGYVLVWTPDGHVREHRLVWERYHGPIPPDHDIHHVNGDKQDNRLENLALLSRSEHARLHARADDAHARLVGHRRSLSKSAKLTEEDVRAIRAAYVPGRSMQKDIAAQYRVSIPTISMLVRRITWKHVE